MEWHRSLDGMEAPTALDPLQNVRICQKCWNGKHARYGTKCKETQCRCGCNQQAKKPVKTVDHSRVDDLSRQFGTIEIK